MKKISFIVVFLAALFWHSSAAPAQDAKEISSASKIASVTIYPDRATVVREAEIKLALGSAVRRFQRPPDDPHSELLAGRGPGNGRGQDSRHRSWAANSSIRPLLPEVKKLQAEIDGSAEPSREDQGRDRDARRPGKISAFHPGLDDGQGLRAGCPGKARYFELGKSHGFHRL